MKRDRNQFTLGSLTIVVATIGLLLSVPKANWVALGFWIPNIIAMLLLVLVGFGVAFIGTKLVSGIGLSVSVSALEPRKTRRERPIDPPGRRQM